jgi:hypothetical protein
MYVKDADVYYPIHAIRINEIMNETFFNMMLGDLVRTTTSQSTSRYTLAVRY